MKMWGWSFQYFGTKHGHWTEFTPLWISEDERTNNVYYQKQEFLLTGRIIAHVDIKKKIT